MPSTSGGSDARTHLVLSPSEEQHIEEDLSFEELQRELQGLQQQLHEHGRSLFGGDLPALQKSPLVVNKAEASPAAPPQTTLPLFQEKVRQETGPPAVENIENTTSKHSSNKKCSKNERHLKAENQNLKRQLAEEREELHRLRALSSITETKMTSRMTQLEERLKLLLQNEKKLEKRRVADAEGWRAEFTALRHRLQSAEQRQRKLIALCSITDQDHRDKVLARHNKLGKLKQSSSTAGNRNTINKIIKDTAGAAGRGAVKVTSFNSAVGGPQKEPTQKDDLDVLNYEKFGEEGLQECMGQLSQELDALKSALSSLEHQFYSKK